MLENIIFKTVLGMQMISRKVLPITIYGQKNETIYKAEDPRNCLEAIADNYTYLVLDIHNRKKETGATNVYISLKLTEFSNKKFIIVNHQLIRISYYFRTATECICIRIQSEHEY